MLKISEDEFLNRYHLSPLARPGWEGMRRNAAIVLGNSQDVTLVPELMACLETASPLLREALEWSIAQLQRLGSPSD